MRIHCLFLLLIPAFAMQGQSAPTDRIDSLRQLMMFSSNSNVVIEAGNAWAVAVADTLPDQALEILHRHRLNSRNPQSRKQLYPYTEECLMRYHDIRGNLDSAEIYLEAARADFLARGGSNDWTRLSIEKANRLSLDPPANAAFLLEARKQGGISDSNWAQMTEAIAAIYTPFKPDTAIHFYESARAIHLSRNWYSAEANNRLAQARIFYTGRNYVEAQMQLDSAMQSAMSGKAGHLMGHLQFWQGRCLRKLGLYEQALNNFIIAEQVASAMGIDSLWLQVQLAKAELEEKKGSPDAARQILQAAMNAGKSGESGSAALQVLVDLSRTYDHPKALDSLSTSSGAEKEEVENENIPAFDGKDRIMHRIGLILSIGLLAVLAFFGWRLLGRSQQMAEELD